MNRITRDRLVLRVSPPGDISYVGYLYLMAQHNAYEPQSLLVSVVKQHFQQVDITQGNVFAPSDPAAIAWLAEFLWLDPLELYGLTPHRWAPVFTPIGKDVETIELMGTHQPILPIKKYEKHHLRSHLHAQYCPECLCAAAYHRQVWSLMAVAACSQHGLMLMSHCTRCNRKISIEDVTNATCHHCGFDLRDATTINLEQDRIGLLTQAIIAAIVEQTEDLPELSDKYQLPVPTPRILYLLVHALLRLVAQQSDNRNIHEICGMSKKMIKQFPEHAETIARYRQIATVVKSLCAWPIDFQMLLGWIGGNNLNMAQDYGSFYALLEREWLIPEMDFVQTAFNEMVAERYWRCYNIRMTRRYKETPDFAAEFELLNYQQAGERLGITGESVADLARTGKIQGLKAVDSKHFLFRPEYVENLNQTWSQTMSMQECAESLGTTTKVVSDLMENGLLRAVRGPGVDGHAAWLINERYVEALHARIARCAKPKQRLEQDDDMINLIRATQILSVVGYNAAAVLARALDYKLYLYTPKIWEYPLHAAHFSEREVRNLVETTKRENRWVDRAYIAENMGVKVTVVSRWIEHGLLQPVANWGGAQYFDQDDANRIIREHVFSEEAATMIGIHLLALYKWVKQGRLHPVAGPDIDGSHRYLFARDEIEQWQPGEWMTAPELAEYLNISHTRLLEQVWAGKRQPISGPGIDGFKHYAFRTPLSTLHTDGSR